MPSSSPSRRVPPRPTRRLAPLAPVAWIAIGALGLAAACADDDAATTSADLADASVFDAAAVAPLDGSVKAEDGANSPDPTSCESYCKDVLATCAGDDTQYGTPAECGRFCATFAPGGLGDKDVGTLACRAYHASTTAKTDPRTWCAAAGPFGGGVCGDRCAEFCTLAFAVCRAPAGATGSAPWADQPECVTACAGFAYLDGGVDGGGDGTAGTPGGDTLNCRQRVLRDALRDPARCAELATDSPRCR